MRTWSHNIEAVARAPCAKMLAHKDGGEEQFARDVDMWWHQVAAVLECGVIDDTGEYVGGEIDWKRKMDGYRAAASWIARRMPSPTALCWNRGTLQTQHPKRRSGMNRPDSLETGSKWCVLHADSRTHTCCRSARWTGQPGNTTIRGVNGLPKRIWQADSTRPFLRTISTENPDVPDVGTGRLRYADGCLAPLFALKERRKLNQTVHRRHIRLAHWC